MRRLLPPVLLVGLAILLLGLHFLHPGTRWPSPAPAWVGWALIALALPGLVIARAQFARARSQIMTFATPSNLVTNGLFSVSRNPMYLSMLFLITGLAFVVGHWCGLLAPVIFFAAANWWYIPFEERASTLVFGAEYSAYRQRVRRWL